MLGVEFPICAFSHCRDVVAAVSKAGGLGVLGAVAHSPEMLETELTWIEEETGGRPFGVDLLLPPKYVGADEGGIDAKQIRSLLPEEHRAFLDEMLARYDIPVPSDDERLPVGAGLNVSPKGYEPLLDVAFAHDIRLIASALGPPPPDFVERAHQRNVVVAALAGTKAHAVRHAAAGVDLIVAQGTEAGGHTGEVATMVLVPEVVDAVAPVPVLAAGGIARGRQIAAVVRARRRRRVVRIGVADDRGGRDSAGREGQVPRRLVVRHRALTLAHGQAGADAADGRGPTNGSGPTPRPRSACRCRPRSISDPQFRIHQAANQPDAKARELATYFVGQVVGSLDTVRPARAVVLEMVEEFIDAVQSLEHLVGGESIA